MLIKLGIKGMPIITAAHQRSLMAQTLGLCIGERSSPDSRNNLKNTLACRFYCTSAAPGSVKTAASAVVISCSHEGAELINCQVWT